MPQCTALNLRDSSPCSEPATSSNGLFCDFHARQVHGLYLGYKRRNAELDELEKKPPKVLPKNYITSDFTGVDNGKVLSEVSEYLRRRYSLLLRCIAAREFHHSHFYKDTSDFGHQSFLDKLKNTRTQVANALARIEKRVLQLTYAAEQWYAWATAEQKAADLLSAQEKKKIKNEAALFKAHQVATAKLRAEEEDKQREAAETQDVWDPIEEVIALQRQGYVNMIRFLINKSDLSEEERAMGEKTMEELNKACGGELNILKGERAFQVQSKLKRKGEGWSTKYFHEIQEEKHKEEEEAAKRKYERNKKKREKQKRKKAGKAVAVPAGSSATGEMSQAVTAEEVDDDDDIDDVPTERSHIPQVSQIKPGKGANATSDSGVAAAGQTTPDIHADPDDTDGSKVMKIPDKLTAVDTDKLPLYSDFTGAMQASRALRQIQPQFLDELNADDDENVVESIFRQVKEYSLLRAILGSPSLLVVALESDSVDSFLSDADRVRNTDLRDLAIRLASPTMESMRNACADMACAQILENDPTATAEDNLMIYEPEDPNEKLIKQLLDTFHPSQVPLNKGKTGAKGKGKGKKPPVEIDAARKRQRLKICGKYIHEFTANSPLPRRGWPQFVLLTQCSIWTAIDQCRSWNEFYELSLLAMHGYFDALSHDDWKGPNESFMLQHMRRIGFVAYSFNRNAIQVSGASQTSRRAPGGRSFQATEARTYLCANAARDDPRARAFIKLLQTYSASLVVWARDKLTGEIIADPPEDQKWLCRDMQGAGRVKKHGKWEIREKFSLKFLAAQEKSRTWKFTHFDDYLEIVIWDRCAGREFVVLEQLVARFLHKAYKITDPIAAMANTLNIYEQVAIEEAGVDSSEVEKVREIRKTMQDSSRKVREGFNQIKTKSECHELWYNWVDEELDKEYHPYASKEELIRHVVEKLAAGKRPARMSSEPTTRLPAGRESEDWEDVSSSEEESELDDEGEYEDVNSDDEPYHDEDDPIWMRARREDRDFHEECHELADEYWETMREVMPRDVALYEKQRQMMYEHNMRMVGKVPDPNHPSMNPRPERKGLAKPGTRKSKDEQIFGTARLIPRNWILNQLWTSALWGQKVETPHSPVQPGLEKMYPIEDMRAYATLLDKEARAKSIPEHRPLRTPPEVFAEYDRWMAEHGGGMVAWATRMPMEHVKLIQAGVYKLWKDGHITPSYEGRAYPCFVSEATGAPHWYIDYRELADAGVPWLLHDPQDNPNLSAPPPPDYLLKEARKWAKKYGKSARFSVLRVRSEPEFWPTLMDDEETRECLTFMDATGRIWEWVKHRPRDLPYEDWAVHQALKEMIKDPEQAVPKPWEQRSEEFVRYGTEGWLVMGRNTAETKYWTLWSLSMSRKVNWGFEPDFAKSFLNCNIDFLEKLDPYWWP